MIIFSTPESQRLAKKTANLAKVKLGKINFSAFADGERLVTIKERKQITRPVIIGSLNQPCDNLVDLLLLSSAAKNWSKKAPVAIIPYLGFTRQDRAEPIGSSINAQVIAKMIEASDIDRIVTVDAHSKRALSYFKTNYRNLSALPLFIKTIKKWKLNDPTVVAPDQGAKDRARDLAKLIGSKDVAIITKKRPRPGKAIAVKLNRSVKGRDVIIVDDMIDTGGTLMAAAKLLKKRGARSVYAVATHGIFSNNALSKLRRAGIKHLVITDTIDQKKKSPWLTIVSVAPLLDSSITEG